MTTILNGKYRLQDWFYFSILVTLYLIQDSTFDRPISHLLPSAGINYNTSKYMAWYIDKIKALY